ncbi:NAD-dependent epimerase/dehydratase family protein [Salipiger sp. IMCC34102]|uniref:polysaccharide biosynthesis protein n=1 Tax=Salipiger sp. IMCC34102 TaxID=2510647 RepID=UPI00101BA721|nr:polysaccharide biosynthesis protein [Salipiger sp. IMCC34102]RYH01050.1 NAD-dependent epimerase/dehydratase family protein [Salipiger sp. IMCC34102]
MIDKKSYFKGKCVVVTGGVGSVGREIVEQLLQLDVAMVRVIDNNESALFDMEMEYSGRNDLEFYLADITDEAEIGRTFTGMDVCFHSAALKHVPSCERSPFSALNVNIRGCEVVGRAAIANGLEKVIFTSSDKAVNPTNVMGTTKLMGERLFTAMNFLKAKSNRTKFACTRFGNVLGSRGSVVPLFTRQIAEGGPVTITDERMTRFVMTMEEAADLVIESMVLAKGGEVFITKMPVLRIVDLATTMIADLAPLHDVDPETVETKVTGARPGEKLWEELSTDEEAGRLLEGEKFLIVLPAGHTQSQRAQTYSYDDIEMAASEVVYHSDRQPLMDANEIRDMLNRDGVLPAATARLLAQKTT